MQRGLGYLTRNRNSSHLMALGFVSENRQSPLLRTRDQTLEERRRGSDQEKKCDC